MYATRTATRSSLRSLASAQTTLPYHLLTPAITTRSFSTPKSILIRDILAKPDTPNIKKTPAAWPHPTYTGEQMDSIAPAHREPVDFSDRVALGLMRMLRWGTDTVTRYHHHEKETDPYQMNERKWMIRFIFLETVAGVPGMVGGMVRHMRSMRAMRRDNGWIETLLEEAYNERMHLLTFLKLASPGPLMRLFVLGAQGVFFNAFFISYILSPRTCHRFVGYLEEEAVRTYTGVLKDLDDGYLPTFAALPAPEIAVDYWKMPEGHRTFRDLILYVRADEAKHREVNHTLGNLKQGEDPNPYVSVWEDAVKDHPHPTKGIEFDKPAGWERDEVFELGNKRLIKQDNGELKTLEAAK